MKRETDIQRFFLSKDDGGYIFNALFKPAQPFYSEIVWMLSVFNYILTTYNWNSLRGMPLRSQASGVLLPDSLSQVAVRVLGSEGGEQWPCGQTLLQLDGFGIGAELWTLVDVQDPHGDGRRGLPRQVDSTGQRDLVLCLHRQHEGAGQLKVYGLEEGRHWIIGARSLDAQINLLTVFRCFK